MATFRTRMDFEVYEGFVELFHFRHIGDFFYECLNVRFSEAFQFAVMMLLPLMAEFESFMVKKFFHLLFTTF
ncbi:hypothetical protein DCC85_12295 [Paenibacillus sp. CAA11]|nr:hypothetical protein DCC85_12295 [Paenibacillus sp. CAA11]